MESHAAQGTSSQWPTQADSPSSALTPDIADMLDTRAPFWGKVRTGLGAQMAVLEQGRLWVSGGGE